MLLFGFHFLDLLDAGDRDYQLAHAQQAKLRIKMRDDPFDLVLATPDFHALFTANKPFKHSNIHPTQSYETTTIRHATFIICKERKE